MKGVKNVIIFATGATVGFVTCGVITINSMLKSETIRSVIKNKITDKIDEFMFGEPHENISYTNYHKSCKKPSSRVSYKSYSETYRKTSPRVSYKSYSESKQEHIEDILFETREDAETILSQMHEIIDSYGSVTFADLYDLVGLTACYTDAKYGWTDLTNAAVILVRGGYTLHLPRAFTLDQENIHVEQNIDED